MGAIMPAMGTEEWLPTAAFAKAVGISERSARRILVRAVDGQPWRGNLLTARKVPARGGAGGCSYEVLADSLPAITDAAPPAVAPAVIAAPTPRATGSGTERYEIIRPVIKHPPGSAERGRAGRQAARQAGVHERCIREWIAAYETGGIGALKRKPREDRGQRRHTVSAAWDAWAKEAQLSDATKAQIAAKLERYTRSLWASTTEHGDRRIALLASDKLAELTETAGFEGEAHQLRKVCKLSRRFVRRHQHYRAVAIYDQDAKQWHDKHRPRIRRHREGRWPMDVVVGDVHPMDVLLQRADGSTFTAKLVAFLDWATNRIFACPVFLEKSEGVRQGHVIDATCAMTQEPTWGLPQVLYLDNGGEYGRLDAIADAQRLNIQMRALGDDPAFDKALLERCNPIVRAQPYNAAAKAIEPAFKTLERGFFSMLPGWIGGDRMAKKTANVGREPAPYPHGKAQFLADLQKCMDVYHATPQSGALNGRTPNEAYNAAVEAGWQRRPIARGALLAAFGKDEFRTVRRGAFSFGGRIYTHKAIQELPGDTRIHLRVPPFRDLPEIPVMDASGELLCMAAADPSYDVLDPEGAREAGRRHGRARTGVAKLRADTDPVDVLEAEVRRAGRAEPARIPENTDTIRLSEGYENIGKALETPRAERQAAEEEHEEISRERQRELREHVLSLRKLRATG